MKNPKTVQIPEELFFNLCRYHFFEDWYTPPEDDPTDTGETELRLLESEIQSGLTAKLEAIDRRAAYSAYKDTSAAPADREAARQRYLDLVGMLPSFRWSGLEAPV